MCIIIGGLNITEQFYAEITNRQGLLLTNISSYTIFPLLNSIQPNI